MRQGSSVLLLSLATFFGIFAHSSHAQFSLGTGFTYQGQLKDGGSPVTGSYDFEFKLFNDPTVGTQQGPTVTTNELAVSGGLFSTVLDFGAQFTGQKRWLQIGVRPGADSGSDPYTLLTPRVELTATPNSLYSMNSGALNGKDSLDFLEKDGRAFVIVRTTDSPTSNGLNLIAAYNQAKALTPHGVALSADNRAVVLVPPGQYDLGTGQLLMDAEFVDVVGISSKADDQYLFGTSDGSDTGVIRQTANNVGIENLRVHCTRSSGPSPTDSTTPAAYFPDSDKPATLLRNCKFESDNVSAVSMRYAITYSGRYEFCSAGDVAFGGGGMAIGIFINCSGGYLAFGGGSVAGGTFTNCSGGTFAFGSVASGTFTNCTGADFAFGGAGTASGTFNNCIGDDYAFGGKGTASGTFTNCTGGNHAFGGADSSPGSSGTASGIFTDCSGADFAFGGFGTANGTFRHCIGGDLVFGAMGTASGIFTDCTGADSAFGGGIFGTASGTFKNCTGGSNSFGGAGTASNGKFFHCNGGLASFTEVGVPAPVQFFCTRGGAQYSGNNP